MELHLKIIGALLICLGSIHVIFPRYFNWKEELKSLSLINRQIMMVHTFFIAVMVILMGILCLSAGADILHTALGKKIAIGLGIFWSLRLLIQFFGYSPQLWRGKTFETLVHILFALTWIYLSIVFWMIGLAD